MFDRVAARYDLLNSLMSAGLHHRWRERAADRAELAPGDSALDVCCGTGDLTLELASRLAPGGSVVGCDFSEPMLDLAREKAEARDADGRPLRVGRRAQPSLRRRPLRRRHRRLRRPQLRRPRPRPARDGPRAAPGRQAGRARVHAAHAGLRSRPSTRSGSTASRRSSAASPTIPRPTPTWPSRCAASPAPAAWPRRWIAPPASRRSATRSSPAASSRSTPASPGDPPLGRTAAGHRGARRLEHAGCRRASARSRTCCASRSSGHGELLAADAGATLAAGGKRLRPLLVLLCAGPDGGAEAVRAATAIELVHMATLVHDDILDAAPLRRGRPTVVAASGRERAVGTGDLLFSRAFALLAAAGDARSIELLAEASVALARGELAQRQDAFDTAISEQRYLERCRLKTATLFRCAVLLGRDDEAMAEFGVVDRARLPAARRRARRLRPARAHRQGARHRPARRHRHPAADPRRRARAGARRHRPALPRRRRRPRRSATGSPPPAPSTRSARGRWRWSPRRSRGLADAGLDAEQRRLLDLVADGVVQRYS